MLIRRRHTRIEIEHKTLRISGPTASTYNEAILPSSPAGVAEPILLKPSEPDPRSEAALLTTLLEIPR